MAVAGFDCAHLQFSDTSVSSATTRGAMEQENMGDVIERAVKPGVRKSLLFGSTPSFTSCGSVGAITCPL